MNQLIYIVTVLLALYLYQILSTFLNINDNILVSFIGFRHRDQKLLEEFVEHIILLIVLFLEYEL
jgi:hypothetical protein